MIKAGMTLAEAATSHPDGTVSMLRAGITHAWGPQVPVPLQGVLVVRIEGELSDEGPHRFDMRCMDEDGAGALPTIEGQFRVPQGGGSNSLTVGISVSFKKFGKYVFVVRVDNVELDRWTITVSERQSQEKPA